MKKSSMLGLGGGLLLVWSAVWGGTVAPVYPGAVADAKAGDVTYRVFLSRAPLAKVTAWYAARAGTLTKDAGVTLWNADGGDDAVGRPTGATDPQVTVQRLGAVTMGQAEVARALKDMTLTRDVGVLCEGMGFKPPQAAGGAADAPANGDGAVAGRMAALQRQLAQAGAEMAAASGPNGPTIAQMSDLFEGLRQEALSGAHGHTRKELLAVYAKYRHLETAWYPAVKTDAGEVSYDRWLLAKDRDKLSGENAAATAPLATGAGAVQALAARVQAAAAAGRMDEVQALSARMQAAMQAQQGAGAQAGAVVAQDRWSFWLTFLKDLDAHAYRTRIRINTAPASWGY